MKVILTKKEWKTTSTDKEGNVVTVATILITMVAIQSAKDLTQPIGETYAHV